MQLADSLNRLGTETAFEVLARAKALEASGRRIIHLQIGEPDFTRRATSSTPGARPGRRRDALLPRARHAGAARGLRRVPLAPSRLEIDPGNIVVAPGAKPFLFFGVLATCNPGDEVIYPNPGFPIYESVIRWAGATPVPLPITEERDFAFSVDDLAERLTPKTKLVILNSPANPTGGIVPRELNVRDGEAARRPRLLDPLGRGLLRDGLRRRARHDRLARGPARAHDPARRLLEDVRDDRLAARLRGGAEAARRAAHAPVHQLRLVHRAGRAAGRRRGARGAAGRRSTR